MSTLAEKGNWDDFNEEENSNGNGKQNDRPKTLYMDTSKPGKYTVRPVGPHVKCRKLFDPYRATLNDADRDTDPAWKAGFYPQKRYAINVIDRADGKLKILEKGASVFKQFANYKSVFGKNPSDKEVGADFLITVTVPKFPDGRPNKKKTEYNVTHLKETPLTKEEIAMISAQRLWPLTEIYKPTALEKRVEMWNALSDAAKIPPERENKDKGSETKAEEKSETKSETKPETKPATSVEEKMPDSPADSSDLFGDEANDGEEKAESAELF